MQTTKSGARGGKRPPARPRTHADRADDYARRVAAGEILACKWIRLAAQRHIDDRERARTSNWPYFWEPERANWACGFIEALPHTKGIWAQRHELLRLEDWQTFIVASLFGWLEKATGDYRFWEAYVCIPRKNGKSPMAAAIGHLKFAAEGEHGAEVYCGASSEKQAWEVFRPARLMAVHTPEYCDAFGIDVHAKSLTIFANGSRFEPVIGKPGDGAAPSCAILDEFHEQPTADLYDTMKTGMVGRQNPLLLEVTTAGIDLAGPCRLKQDEAEKMLEGVIPNDRLLALIFTIDAGDDYRTELALRKANPNYGVSVDPRKLEAAQREASESAYKLNVFLTKHLNVWVNQATAWMNMGKWRDLGDTSLRLEDFTKDPCIIGLDLASSIDLVAKVRVFRRDQDGKPHYYAFAQHYLNEAQVQIAKNASYAGWVNLGLLIATPGNLTDFPTVGDGLAADVRAYRVKSIPHDPWRAAQLIQFLQARPDFPQHNLFVQVNQTVQNLSPAMKALEALVVDGRLHHNGDPILTWEISNVIAKRDRKDNIFPHKARPENKIDGALALMMAVGDWARLENLRPSKPAITVLS